MEIKYKVTIVTVVLNDEDKIQNTIDSVYKQEYKNFEYILLDGLSQDNTCSIIKYNQIKFNELGRSYSWYSEKDQGIYSAMNKAVKYAHGEWILFLNSGDELYNSTCLADIFEDDRVNSYDVVYGDTILTYKNGEMYSPSRETDRIINKIPFCHQSVFTRISLIETHPFDEQYRIAADYEFYLYCYFTHKKFLQIAAPISKYSKFGYSSRHSAVASREYWKIKYMYGIPIPNIFQRFVLQMYHHIYDSYLYKYQKEYLKIGQIRGNL